jgi:NAD(P)-dependent dehydrogenase (short-subunit alcohol dehydrogenase family)
MVALDVTEDTSVLACVAHIIAAEGRLDVLINNAGVGVCGSVEDTAIDEARWQMETNFFGPVRMINAVLPVMRTQGRGRIITVSSLAGLAALPYQPFYSASKFAIEGLNEALRLELGASGIDATTINPGDFKTGFTAARVFTRSARSGRHAEQLAKTVAIYERDEMNGADPSRVAELALRLVEADRVAVRYAVGRFDQRFGMLLKRWLPATMFERLMKVTYSLP